MIIQHSAGDITGKIEIIETENPPALVRQDYADVFANSSNFCGHFIVRKTVYNMLCGAAGNLPKGVRLKLYELYRPKSKQIAEWNVLYAENKARHPDWDEVTLERETNVFVANPYKQGSGHQSGGAIDLTLCREDGIALDMGGGYCEFNEKTATFPEKGVLSEDAERNRRVLYDAMTARGFVNYPCEWWHYSYGELEWALLSGIGKTLYAALDL